MEKEIALRENAAKLRIEVVKQSVEKIDSLNRAIVACRLKFWNALNRPVQHAEFHMLDCGTRKDIGKSRTDINGESDIRFCMDIVSEIRARVDFVFNEQKQIRRVRTFILKDETNPQMQNRIDEIRFSHAMKEDIMAMLENPDDLALIGEFFLKYGNKISPENTAQIMESLKRKWKQLKRERIAREQQEEARREYESYIYERNTRIEREEREKQAKIEEEIWQERLRKKEENREFVNNLIGTGIGFLVNVGIILQGGKPKYK